MKHYALAVLLATPLSACFADETISGFADPNVTYSLQSLGGETFRARATLRFPQAGSIAGQAPCNSFSASQTAPYPWFELGQMRVTRMACADMAQEQAFFAALSRMTLAEVAGAVLILSSESGEEMVFQAAPG